MKKIKVGITGQAGLIGTHLSNYLRLKSAEIELVPFEDSYFKNKDQLSHFVLQCDTIVHLAAMNRGNPEEIYKCNIGLVKKFIGVLGETNHKPYIIFSSSIQEERDNLYGKSKKEGRKLFEEWASKNNAKFTALIIPNVFGPFGLPFYNMVISTFCYQLTHNLEPKIKIDANLKLIYINDLIEIIYHTIKEKSNNSLIYIEPIAEGKVSDILEQLIEFKRIYLEQNIIPELKNHFDISLFNTFRSYIEYNYYPVYLNMHLDNRGYLCEIIKSNTGGQIFLSHTKPGITRGNHFHRRKIERFCVLQGDAIIRLRKIGTDSIIEYKVNGSQPAIVDIPIFHIHNITNIGGKNLLTSFWTNEFFNPEDSDTYHEEV